MKELAAKIYLVNKKFWTKKHFLSLISTLFLFAIALSAQKIADAYVKTINGVAVGDIILNNVPTVDVDVLIIYGSLIFTFLILFLVIEKPRYLIFTLKALSVFIIVRSFLISLTHLGVNPQEVKFDTHIFGFGLYNFLYNTKNDFFFSGHTGVPFLMALIFWNEKFWGRFFVFVSLFFGTSVLLGHIHYSIDVFAAPLITYSIFEIAKALFTKDFDLIANIK
jgi:hypothetical protein